MKKIIATVLLALPLVCGASPASRLCVSVANLAGSVADSRQVMTWNETEKFLNKDSSGRIHTAMMDIYAEAYYNWSALGKQHAENMAFRLCTIKMREFGD